LNTLTVAPWPPTFFNDEAYYRTLAALIARGVGFVRPGEFYGQGLAVPTAERPPLYPLLLAGMWKLGANGPDAQRLLGAFAGAGTIAALGLLGRRLAGPRVGLLAAALAAIYPTLIAADGALMTESLFGLLAAVGLLAAYRLLDAPAAGRAVVLGVVLGLAALTRGEGLLLFPLVLVPVLRRPGGLRATGVAFLTFAVVLAPWTIRNWSVFDRPVLVATEGGETLAGANCDAVYYGDGIGKWEVDCVDVSARGNEAEELDRAGHDGVRYAADHLGRLPAVVGARLARTFGVLGPLERQEGRAEWVVALGVGMYAVLIVLAVAGLVLLHRRRVPVWIITMPFVTAAVTTVVGYGNPRFRHAAELALVVLAAVALDALAVGHEERRRRATTTSSPSAAPRVTSTPAVHDAGS
jgi:4-amino-4-deoxy-L-arabinose transferase-like glycosyltransferase